MEAGLLSCDSLQALRGLPSPCAASRVVLCVPVRCWRPGGSHEGEPRVRAEAGGMCLRFLVASPGWTQVFVK